MSTIDPLLTPPTENGALPVPPAEAPAGPPLADLHLPYPGEEPDRRTPPRPHPGFWWSLLWCVGFFIITQISGGVVASIFLVVLHFTRPELFPANSDNLNVLMSSEGYSISVAVGFSISVMLGVGVSLLVIRLVVGRDWTRQLALRRPGLAHVMFVLAGCPAFVILGNWSYAFLRQVLHVPSFTSMGLPGMEYAEKLFSSWPTALGILVIGLGPGVGEELWCRGFLGRGLVGRYGPAVGVVLTSFFFGLIHLDPAQGSMALLMGLWLHFVYLMTRSLWMSMLIHFLNNSFAVVAPHIPGVRVVDAGLRMPPFLVIASALLLACIGWALYRSRARLVPETDGPETWQPPYPGVAYPPPGSGTRVTHPRPSWDAVAAAAVGFLLFLAACVEASSH